MATQFEPAVEQDLIDRGYSRRQMAKVAALLGAGAAAIRVTGAGAQQAAKPVAGAVRIGANECWTGPFPVAAKAAFKLWRKATATNLTMNIRSCSMPSPRSKASPPIASSPGPDRPTR